MKNHSWVKHFPGVNPGSFNTKRHARARVHTHTHSLTHSTAPLGSVRIIKSVGSDNIYGQLRFLQNPILMARLHFNPLFRHIPIRPINP